MNIVRSLTVSALAATTLMGPGVAAQAAEPPAQTSAAASVGTEIPDDDMAGWVHRHDGVKGVLRNTSDKTIVVSIRENCDLGSVRLLPGQSAQFANSLEYDLRTFRGVQGVKLRVWLDGQDTRTKPVAIVTIGDHTVYRPISETKVGSVSNYRDGWREGQSHWEISGSDRIELKRENDSWRGRFEQNGYTDDWAAFHVNVNSVS